MDISFTMGILRYFIDPLSFLHCHYAALGFATAHFQENGTSEILLIYFPSTFRIVLVSSVFVR